MQSQNLYLAAFLFGLAMNISSISAQNSAAPLLFPYQFNRINPAQIGFEERPQLGASFNTQWLGIPQAPKSQLLFFENPRGNNRLAYGAFINSNNHFVKEQIHALLQFSIENQFFENGFLYFGLQAGANYHQIHFEGLQSVDSIEADLLLQRQNFWKPQLGLGIFLKMENFFFAASLPQLLHRDTIASPVDVVAAKQLTYYVRLGYEIAWHSRWHTSLSLSLQRFDEKMGHLALQGEIGTAFARLFFNVDLNKNIAAGLLLHEKKWISVGYAYAVFAKTKKVLPIKNHTVSLLFRLGSN